MPNLWRDVLTDADRAKVMALAGLAEQAIRDGFPVQRTRPQRPKEEPADKPHVWAASLDRARREAAKKKGKPA